ncbi:MAG: hypothetical protein K2G94_09550 [Muribaculaceae bacterium]|nr:hypothetical protein [Muribaculaceae bacterium]
MVARKLIAGMAFASVVGLCGCTSSENDEPQGSGEQLPIGVSGIGFSVDKVCLLAYAESDTIFFDSDDWTVSSVSFGGEMNKKYPKLYPLTTYITDLSGTSPFDENVEWLHLHYADRKLVLRDIEPFCDDEFPKYRYAYLEFQRGEVTDTLVCENETPFPNIC